MRPTPTGFNTPPPIHLNTPSPKLEITRNRTKSKTSNLKHANDPDYEYDVTSNYWRRKSDLRPLELVNRYKAFLMHQLTASSDVDPKEIGKIVRKHATSTRRIKEILVEKGIMTKTQAIHFFKTNSFWEKELCNHMKKVCPTQTDLSGDDWCTYAEEALFYNKDPKTKIVSCFSASDIIQIISSSFIGEENGIPFLQLPRDPYTRKVLTQDFIKKWLRLARAHKSALSKVAYAHVVYFLRHYKRFYKDPAIKPFLTKSTLTKKEKWELSDAIEDFLMETDEIRNSRTKQGGRWWYWKSGKKPADTREYIFHDTNTIS